LGTALVTGGAILLYGETGNGKTSIAERLQKLFNDSVYIPHAVEISGHIIAVFDPQIHQSQESQPSVDARWVQCRRPMVKVGGELTSEMLEARVDEVTRIGVAPLQMKANNGIMLIDDFGRQRIAPRELLNRWIVPMDRRVDLLSLSGMSFEIPFEVLVVFATNLLVSDLAEDAFLRRLKNKIKVESLSEDLFKELTRRACRMKGLPLTPDIEEYFVQECSKYAKGQLRACFPLDITAIVSGMATFERRGSRLDKEDVDSALAVYFAH
jgi:predicted ATPase with chaperone activity